MAPPVTEIAYLSFKPGVDIEGSTPEAQVWQSALTTIKAQEGFQRAAYGRLFESPNVLMLFIDWDTHQNHLNFMSSPAYGPFVSGLSSLVESIHIHHFTPSPFPPNILTEAPVNEFATFYNVEPGFVSNVEKFISEALNAAPDGFLGIAYGETVEGDVVKHAEQGVDGAKAGKAAVLLIGWESKEAHLRFREKEVFKKHIYLLREKTTGGEVFHVAAKTA